MMLKNVLFVDFYSYTTITQIAWVQMCLECPSSGPFQMAVADMEIFVYFHITFKSCVSQIKKLFTATSK